MGGLADALITIGSFLVAMARFLSGDQLILSLIARVFKKDNSCKLENQKHSNKVLLGLLAKRKPFQTKS